MGTNYTRASYEDGAGGRRSLARVAAGATHALSKTAAVYGGAAAHVGAQKESIVEEKVFQIGLRKGF